MSNLDTRDNSRIGYVVKCYPRYSETFVVNEILALEQRGMELDIFALRPPRDTHFQDIIARVRAPVHYLPSRAPKAADFWDVMQAVARWAPADRLLDAARDENAHDVHQALLLAQAIRERGIRHLHAHFASSATGVARMAARFAGIGYSFTTHAKDIYHDSVVGDDLYRKLTGAAAVVTVSDYNLNHLRERFGDVPVERIYNGLDLDDFPYRSPADRPPRIVAVGRLVEKKGFVDLIDACSLLVERGRKLDCQLIGGGELEAELRERIAARGLQRRVELTGPLPQREVVRRVQAGAVLAAPCVIGRDSNRDGLPTVLLEAMALGTPCVSTDVTGIPEILTDGVTGLQVPQHDPAALASALERLLADSSLRVRLAEAARRRIEQDFDVRHNVAGLQRIFARAIEQGANRREAA